MRLIIEAFGRPAPQGSKELGGAGQLRESSAYLPAWRTAVRSGAYEAYRAAGLGRPGLTFGNPYRYLDLVDRNPHDFRTTCRARPNPGGLAVPGIRNHGTAPDR